MCVIYIIKPVLKDECSGPNSVCTPKSSDDSSSLIARRRGFEQQLRLKFIDKGNFFEQKKIIWYSLQSIILNCRGNV